MLDALGDHSHTCSQNIGFTKDAHEHILSGVESVVKLDGFITRRQKVTWRTKGRHNINLAGKAHLVIQSDVAMMHDFSGDCWRDVSQHGQLRYADLFLCCLLALI